MHRWTSLSTWHPHNPVSCLITVAAKINDLTMGSAELAVLLLRKAEVMIAFVERLLCAG